MGWGKQGEGWGKQGEGWRGKGRGRGRGVQGNTWEKYEEGEGAVEANASPPNCVNRCPEWALERGWMTCCSRT